MVRESYEPVSVPIGGIIMWSGTASDIPAGWHLCDGSNGTPDLRNRFVMGAGGSYSVGSTGGSNTHTMTIQEMPSHSHSSGSLQLYVHSTNADSGVIRNPAGVDILMNRYSENVHVRNLANANTFDVANPPIYGSVNYTGNGSAFNILNPYYVLAFIMLVGDN